MEIGVETISVKSNPRTDFGDIEELTASIKEKGVIEPLVVKDLGDGKYELIAGERRLRASKAAGLEKVPVSVYSGDDADIEEVKLIENIQRKDLSPVEEAVAFKAYMDSTKASVETLAQKLAKQKVYVDRRLALLDLPPEIKKALETGKLLLGHALIIARLKGAKAQRSMFKEIVGQHMSVKDAESHVQNQDTTAELRHAVFSKDECKGCRYNGGEQSVLFDTGSELKGICLDKTCFLKKTREWKKVETKKLQDKGVKVLSPEQIQALKVKEQVYTWNDDYKKIVAKLHKEPDNYAVVFTDRYYGGIEKEIYCLNPSARHPKKAAEDKKQKASNADDRLTVKVAEHKRGVLRGKTQELIKPSSKETKALALFALLEEGGSYSDNDRRDAVSKIIRTEKIGTNSLGGWDPRFSKILALKEADIDRITAAVAGQWAKNLGNELMKGASAFGVSLDKHFLVSEDYLNFHTKAQLIDLAREIGLDKHLEEAGNEKWDKAKKGDLIKSFLESGFDLKGKVPKLMQKTR